MRSTKLWEMNNRLFILLFFSAFLTILRCRETKSFGSCNFALTPSSRMFLFVDSIFETNFPCVYHINSSYFEAELFMGKLTFKDKTVLVNFTNEDGCWEDFFSFKESKGSQNKITIRHRNWKEKKPDEVIQIEYTVILENILKIKNDKIAHLRIVDVIHSNPEIGNMDAIVFFSSAKGFIGSYYSSTLEPCLIISAAGNILENQIDYSGYSFVTIH